MVARESLGILIIVGGLVIYDMFQMFVGMNVI